MIECQVEYALAAVRKGSTAVAIVANGAIVIGVEKKSTAKLQVSQTVRKIVKLDQSASSVLIICSHCLS
jgi:20S proteasome alpha/beta subunit